jgi:hypothetical protein
VRSLRERTLGFEIRPLQGQDGHGVKIAYSVRRFETTAPAAALLVPGHDPAALFDVLRRLGLDPLSRVFAVADGFVVKLPVASDVALAGAVRLRAMAADLLLPVDADLEPELLPDEAAALVRQRGLVFLPGPRVLSYAPDAPLPVTALLHLGPLDKPQCATLPQPPRLAESVVEMTLADTGADDVLDAGRSDIGSEPPELPEGKLPARAAAQALMKLGQGFAALGKGLGLRGLSAAGARLLAAAMTLAPKLSEELLGRQEAALRALLEDFRAGNIERALRRALPLNADPGRGAGPAQDASLPTHRLFYSLLELLGSGGGVGALWATPADTYQQLQAEYRKQAELAARQGDYRRAAFILARLLNDFRGAATVLGQGGLQRDAARIYEHKLHDLAAAARAWESAGEIDRAVALFHKLGDHAAAGDALRRAGEVERAILEYHLAADRLAAGAAFYEAAELLANRAHRTDLALDYYRRGWQAPGATAALPCLLRLVQHHAQAGEIEALRGYIDEADPFLQNRLLDAGKFYNRLAQLAETPPVAAAADELRDRALCGLARRLRSSEGQPAAARWNALFGAQGPWPAPLLHDAQYALKQSRRAGARVEPRILHAGNSGVTAFCHAPGSGAVFLGFADGEIICYQPRDGSLTVVARDPGTVVGLAAHAAGSCLAVLQQTGEDEARLRLLQRTHRFETRGEGSIRSTTPPWMCTPSFQGLTGDVLIGCGRDYQSYRLPGLVREQTFASADVEELPVAGCNGMLPGQPPRQFLLSVHEHGMLEVWLRDAGQQALWQACGRAHLGWTPGLPGDVTLRQSSLHVAPEAQQLLVTGLDDNGVLHQSCASPLVPEASHIRSYFAHGADRYRTFAVLQPGRIAAVHERGVDWCSPGSDQPQRTRVRLTDPVAAVPLSGETLLVIGADGTLTTLVAAT